MELKGKKEKSESKMPANRSKAKLTCFPGPTAPTFSSGISLRHIGPSR